MSLPAGEKLGPYEIIEPIGAGGMGEVYRARDPRLGRDVAIKVSAERFSERFDREARAIAALNHPNICHIYDVGPNYLVMELIEGENLKGPLPLATAVKFAQQIADALEAAHEKISSIAISNPPTSKSHQVALSRSWTSASPRWHRLPPRFPKIPPP